MQTLKDMARDIVGTLAYHGLDLPRIARSLAAIPGYLRRRKEFLRAGGRIDGIMPRLLDHGQTNGCISDYLMQDLIVARRVILTPHAHLDVGSRVDGFVAMVAASRQIAVADVRPPAGKMPNVAFFELDLMGPTPPGLGWPSVSCLHAAEHCGLGRYGDTIDPGGHLRAIEGLRGLLAVSGRLYLSVPLGKPGVYFDAHRLFSVEEMTALLSPWLDLEPPHIIGSIGLFVGVKR